MKVLESAPPIPSQVITTNGRLLFDEPTIQNGQSAWQSIGGREGGTIRGHGSSVAPDWKAGWLHREGRIVQLIASRKDQGQGSVRTWDTWAGRLARKRNRPPKASTTTSSNPAIRSLSGSRSGPSGTSTSAR